MGSNSKRLHDLTGFGNGVSLLLKSLCNAQSNQLQKVLQNKNLHKDIQSVIFEAESLISQCIQKSPKESMETLSKKTGALFQQTNQLLNSEAIKQRMPNFFSSKRNMHFYALNSSSHTYYNQIRKYSDEKVSKKGINLNDSKHKFEHKVN